MKKPKYRVFDYTPRFYKPEEDPDERRKRKLGFRRSRKIKGKRKLTSPVVWFLLLIIVLYIYLKLTGNV